MGKDQVSRTNEFLVERQKYISEGRHFASIDETSFGRNGVNTRGYAMKGKKLQIFKNPQRKITTSAVCCVSMDGLMSMTKQTGSFNTSSFACFIHSLTLPKGTVILLDNVSFHRSATVQNAISEMGYVALFIPPYSPWFNPIEMCFSIVKRSYYKHLDIDRAFQDLRKDHILTFFDKSLNCEEAF